MNIVRIKTSKYISASKRYPAMLILVATPTIRGMGTLDEWFGITSGPFGTVFFESSHIASLPSPSWSCL